MAVEANCLHLKEEGKKETSENGEEFYGEPELACIPKNKLNAAFLKSARPPAAVCHQDGDNGGEHDGR